MPLKDRRESVVAAEIDDVPDGKPLYVKAILSLLNAFFVVYDAMVFLPFHFFANPGKRVERSNRTKASPVNSKNPASPWRNVEVLEGELSKTLITGALTLAELWDEAVRRYGSSDCFGVREVLRVVKETQPNGKVFEKMELGRYTFRSFVQVNDRINMIASALADLGQKPKRHIVIFAETREEWFTTALACFRQNYPVATVYATLGEDAVEFAIEQVEAETVFTSASLLQKVYAVIKKGVAIKNVIYFESQNPEEVGNVVKSPEGVHTFSFDQLLSAGKTEPITSKSTRDDIAMTMYTSGTTGTPKGVMLTHGNILGATAGQGKDLDIGQKDTYVAYLPLAHILEVCAEVVCIAKGTRIGYSSAQTLFDKAAKVSRGSKGDCKELRPTLMACVPAVMDRIYKAVIAEINSKHIVIRELFVTCFERKRARTAEGYISMFLDKFIFASAKGLLGGRVRYILSGGAPLSAETQRFMNICFNCPVAQGYGLTETCGGGTIADLSDLSTGTVGPPLTCCEIMLREWAEGGYLPSNENPQGEILIHGTNVALGYYKLPEKTAEDFITIDGKTYFCTGDIGEFRNDGSLKIIDRKKDLLKLAHGEYISLGKVETTLLTCPLVENICAYGDSTKDFIVAFVVPNHKPLTDLAEKIGVSGTWEELCANKTLNKALHSELVSYIGNKLSRVETPQKILLSSEPWTAQNGLLTEALKLKRKPIEEYYQNEIKEMYA